MLLLLLLLLPLLPPFLLLFLLLLPPLLAWSLKLYAKITSSVYEQSCQNKDMYEKRCYQRHERSVPVEDNPG